ncbi:MAG: hypothetical protein K940chlam5_01475 [Candidatus Anoxychlamydiales bacterium]|nr:hypothetical protein [Candidatus Anoxychlamydiales bacterium]
MTSTGNSTPPVQPRKVPKGGPKEVIANNEPKVFGAVLAITLFAVGILTHNYGLIGVGSIGGGSIGVHFVYNIIQNYKKEKHDEKNPIIAG